MGSLNFSLGQRIMVWSTNPEFVDLKPETRKSPLFVGPPAIGTVLSLTAKKGPRVALDDRGPICNWFGSDGEDSPSFASCRPLDPDEFSNQTRLYLEAVDAMKEAKRVAEAAKRGRRDEIRSENSSLYQTVEAVLEAASYESHAASAGFEKTEKLWVFGSFLEDGQTKLIAVAQATGAIVAEWLGSEDAERADVIADFVDILQPAVTVAK